MDRQDAYFQICFSCEYEVSTFYGFPPEPVDSLKHHPVPTALPSPGRRQGEYYCGLLPAKQ